MFNTSDHHVFLGLSTTLYDYIGFDTTPQQNLTITNIQPISADLHWRGYSAIDNVNATEPKFNYYDTNTIPLYSNPRGNFTNYGDVTPLLNQSDDEYVIMRHGDEMSLTFPYDGGPAEGTQRDFMLYSYAYYKQANDTNGSTVEPLPFMNMSTYPPLSNESYPYDAEHQNYLSTWNQRYYDGSSSESSPEATCHHPPAISYTATSSMAAHQAWHFISLQKQARRHTTTR